MKKIYDTIAAISTPRGKGGVAMIRISGTDALCVAERIFIPKSGKRLSAFPANRCIYGDIMAFLPGGEMFAADDGIAAVYRAPHSFTGEDTVEITCHGGLLVSATVLEAALCAGARAATAGEFTKRAFVNGKLGLSQAESLGLLLEAKTTAQLYLSRGGLNGRLSAKSGEIYNALKRIAANMYAKMDFPDEDLDEMTRAEIISELNRIAETTEALAATYKTGRSVLEGIRTVICGRTNVGKSTLYNRLVGRQAAIVTDIEGTTRDVLEETVSLGNVTLRLCDTAGLRDGKKADSIEKIGIEKARREIENAELVLAVFDATRPPDEDDYNIIEEKKKSDAVFIAVINKTDEIAGDKANENKPDMSAITDNFEHIVFMSAKSGDGADKLKSIVAELFTDGSIDLRNDAVITGARQYAAAWRALESIKSGAEGLSMGLPYDICSLDIESAMSRIAEIDGRAVGEDIVAEIFSHFCVGK